MFPEHDLADQLVAAAARRYGRPPHWAFAGDPLQGKHALAFGTSHDLLGKGLWVREEIRDLLLLRGKNAWADQQEFWRDLFEQFFWNTDGLAFVWLAREWPLWCGGMAERLVPERVEDFTFLGHPNRIHEKVEIHFDAVGPPLRIETRSLVFAYRHERRQRMVKNWRRQREDQLEDNLVVLGEEEAHLLQTLGYAEMMRIVPAYRDFYLPGLGGTVGRLTSPVVWLTRLMPGVDDADSVSVRIDPVSGETIAVTCGSLSFRVMLRQFPDLRSLLAQQRMNGVVA